MNRSRAWILAVILGLVPAVALAQYDPNDESGRGRRGGRNGAAQGLFFTPSIVDKAINRIVDQMATHYEFDEAQLWDTREVIKERFPVWLEQNRGELVTLANEYVEAILGDEPPTPEQVAEWSGRALPLFNDFADLAEDVGEEMRTYMTDEQQVILDGEMAAFRVGMGYMNQRMEVWKGGGYDWKTEWPRGERFREAERERLETFHTEVDQARWEAIGYEIEGDDAAALAESERPAQQPTHKAPAKSKDEWTIYVEDFIRRYQLNEAQQNSARRVLHSLQESRDKHLRRKLPAIKEIEEQLKVAENDEDRQKLKDRYDEINQPIVRLFLRLKERLDKLPTRAQRAAAAKAQMEALSSAEKPSEKQETGSEGATGEEHVKKESPSSP